VKVKDLSLSVACPTCDARPQRRCELNSGGFRTDSHRQRKDLATEKAVLKAALTGRKIKRNRRVFSFHK
jgi:hypothetical protein